MTDRPTCETKLLPCPWCNGNAELDRRQENYGYSYGGYQVKCTNCKSVRAGGYFEDTRYDWENKKHISQDQWARAQAHRLWNTRNGQLQTDIGARKES